MERASGGILVEGEGEPLNLVLEDVEKGWKLQCGMASLGILCKDISSCPSCQYLGVLLHSSLQSVAIPMIFLRPRLLVGRF